MKKLSTHIKGLDKLFYGGIQVTSVTDVHSESDTDNRLRDSLVIIIRGCRGCHKHLFAMQLMHGLGISIFDFLERAQLGDKLQNLEELKYYSINKPTHLLKDMYLDLLIERWITRINIDYKKLLLNDELKLEDKQAEDERGTPQEDISTGETRKGKTKSNETQSIASEGVSDSQDKGNSGRIEGIGSSDTDSRCKVNQPTSPKDQLNSIAQKVSDAIFEIKEKDENNLSQYVKNKLAELISENIIGYNPRTNSLHIRTEMENDEASNLLWKRQNDSKVFENINKIRLDESLRSASFFNSCREFLNASFNPHLGKDDGSISIPIRNANSARTSFFEILNNIEDSLDKHEQSGDDSRFDYITDILVIDGFSHISEKDLQTLPYNHLITCLRKTSRISILVFEDNQCHIPDGDIEIEIRSNYDMGEEYFYNELRVSKCVNQAASSGWHLYKRKDSHIRVYPSLHLRLFKRSYINNQMFDIGRSILENNYNAYLDSISKNEEPKYIGKQGDIKNYPVEEYFTDRENHTVALFKYLHERIKRFFEVENSKKYYQKVLENILSGSWQDENCKMDNGELPLHSSQPITAIVGNLNSHKRNLATLSSFLRLGKSGCSDRVLVILLNKDPQEMRKRFLCPAMNSILKEDSEKCKKCYKRISFLNVNPGCITPEEFISMIQDHIRLYTDYETAGDKPKSKRNLLIIFDDYHRIDFSYPFLKASNLFINSLISLCQSYNVGMTILCDKSSERVREVCTLSDYVLCIKREESDKNKIQVYTERIGDEVHSSTIIKFTLKLPLEMNCPNSVNQHTNTQFLPIPLKIDRLGSMKDYWRETMNTIETKH